MRDITILWRGCTVLLLVGMTVGTAFLSVATPTITPAAVAIRVPRLPLAHVATPVRSVALVPTSATATPTRAAQASKPAAVDHVRADDDLVILRSTDDDDAGVVATTNAVITSTMPLTMTDEPPIMTQAEIAAAEAAMRDGQGRMSKARTQFRLAAIATAEKEVAMAAKELEKIRAEHIKQEDVTAAETEMAAAQADFDRVRLENISLLDSGQAEANVQAAETQLQAAQSQTDPDPTLAAIAEERLQAAQQQYTSIVNEASARTAQVELVMNNAATTLQQAQDTVVTTTQYKELAQQGIDPVSGKRFEDTGLDPEAQTQHYMLQHAAAQASLDDATTKFNGAAGDFEWVKQQQIIDVAAAQVVVEQAQAELSQIPQGSDPARIIQAQQNLDTARTQLSQTEQGAPVVAQAQQRMQDAQAKFDAVKADWAVAGPLIAGAQKRVDVAQTALKQARQNAVGKGGWTWPSFGTLSSGFGKRNLKVNSYHNGIDIANVKNTPIGAARAGVVTEAGWCKGYGFCVKIDHGGGFTAEYGHMASAPLVKAGDPIEAGTIVGLMGTTYDEEHGGYSTGVHLHLTIRRNGVSVDPLLYLP